MQRFIDLVQQAITEFSAHNFDAVTNLLLHACRQLSIENLSMTPVFYNALCDAVEMIDLICQHFPIIVYKGYLKQSVTNLKAALLDANTTVSLVVFTQNITAFTLCLQGLEFVLNFSSKQAILTTNPPIFFFQIGEDGILELFENTAVEDERKTAIIDAFNRILVDNQQTTVETYLANYQIFLEEKNLAAAEEQLLQMIEQHPKTQKEGFFHLAVVYTEQNEYEKAADAYMKSMVFGMPKAVIGKKIKNLCSHLIMMADNPKEAKRWQELLMDFF